MSLAAAHPREEPPARPEVGDPREDPKLLIISGRCGRLANRLVLFASIAAFAEERGHRLSNCTFHSYAHLFQTTSRDVYCRYPIPDHRSLPDLLPGVAPAIRKTRLFVHAVRMACLLNERVPVFGSRTMTFREQHGVDLESPEVRTRMRHATRVFIFGWAFRAPNYLKRHAEKVRAYFQPLEQHDRASREVVERLREKADMVVGVHVRHGDHRTWRGAKYFFEVDLYAKWMKEMAALFPGHKVAFLVCSDEPRSEQEFPGLTVGLGPGLPVEDLYALSKCDYVMGPVSTFSQWASFHGNKPLFHIRGHNDHVDRGRFAISYFAEIPQ